MTSKPLKLLASGLGAFLFTLALAGPALAEMGTLRGSPGSQINLRSQPSTRASSPSYGIPGDRVNILNETRGTDGYVWYYVEFPQSRARGWVRGDLLQPDSGNNNPAQRLSFAPGASSATVSGSVRGYETRDYLLNARRNQRMTVNLRSNNSFMEFVIFNPRGETIHVGSTSWSGLLPTNGDYKVRVLLVRAEARRNGAGGFNLTVSIR